MSLRVDPPRLSSVLSHEGKRPPPRSKETQFLFKHGHKHHSYDAEKAPYPVSFDKHVLELESIDNTLLKHVHNSMSFVDFSQWEDGAPMRCLDLGCGSGTWVAEAAKEWPGCEFIGYDLVNVQFPLKLMDESIASRISWMHGNFLTNKLPFEDDEFDHVHIQGIARGVPENKWGTLFEEVNRILRPGGAVEVCEEDIIFPLLPRWFTSPLRSRTHRSPSVHFPGGSQHLHTASLIQDDGPITHDHALLESLYNSVFANRFINTTPTAVLPSYVQTYFRQITMSPVITFPMPPFPPLPPLPQQAAANDIASSLTDPRASIAFPSASPSASTALDRSTSMSMSSLQSSSSSQQETPDYDPDTYRSPTKTRSRGSSSTSTNNDDHPLDNVHLLRKLIIDPSTTEQNSPPLKRFLDNLDNLSERSLAMHLYHSYQSVLACQEAMWEELKDRILNKKESLKPYGWDDDEELEELQSRKKFERLLERYRSDMQNRVSFWFSLTGMGWALPPRDPLSKAELIEEERIRDTMLEARRSAHAEDSQPSCRVMRLLVGYKSEAPI